MACKAHVCHFFSSIFHEISLLFFEISCQAVQNLGLAVVTMISGIIVDNGGFFMLEIFFITWLCSKFYIFFNFF